MSFYIGFLNFPCVEWQEILDFSEECVILHRISPFSYVEWQERLESILRRCLFYIGLVLFYIGPRGVDKWLAASYILRGISQFSLCRSEHRISECVILHRISQFSLCRSDHLGLQRKWEPKWPPVMLRIRSMCPVQYGSGPVWVRSPQWFDTARTGTSPAAEF